MVAITDARRAGVPGSTGQSTFLNKSSRLKNDNPSNRSKPTDFPEVKFLSTDDLPNTSPMRTAVTRNELIDRTITFNPDIIPGTIDVTHSDNPESPSIMEELALNALKPRLKHAQALKTLDETCTEISKPDPLSNPNEAREKINLPGIRPRVIAKAKSLATKIKEELATESKGELQKRIKYDYFQEILTRTGQRHTKEEETLAAFYCIKTAENPFGFLSGLPIGMLEHKRDDFVERARALVRHNMVDLRDDIKTARDLEKFTGWGKFFQAPGLTVVIKDLSIIEIQQIAFPGIFHGSDPPVRMWQQKIERNNDTEGGKELKQLACAWILTKGTGAYNLETGKWDLEVVRKTNWHTTFHKFGLSFKYTDDSHIHSLLDPFKLASEALGIDDPFGIDIENGEIPPWYITRENMWTEIYDNGRMLIDDVTEHLLTRHLPVKYPDCFDEDGNLKPDGYEKIRWTDEYSEVVGDCHCLQESGLKIHEAIARVRPDFFGYTDGQKRLEEVIFSDKWAGKNGKLRLKREMAFALRDAGMNCSVEFFGDNPGISFTGSDFTQWARSYFIGEKTWADFFKDSGLESGVRNGSDRGNGNSMGSALAVLLGANKSAHINLKGKVSGGSILSQAGKSMPDSFFIPIDTIPKKEIALRHFLAKLVDPSYEDLLELRAYYFKNPSKPKNRQTEEYRHFIPDLARNYLCKDDGNDPQLNMTKLVFNLFLYSLKTNEPVEEVFKDFAIRYIDVKMDSMDYSKIWPPEIFEIACVIYSAGFNDFPISVKQRQEGYLNALSLIIKTFEIPGNESGKEMLREFVFDKSKASKYTNDAFHNVYGERNLAISA